MRIAVLLSMTKCPGSTREMQGRASCDANLYAQAKQFLVSNRVRGELVRLGPDIQAPLCMNATQQ